MLVNLKEQISIEKMLYGNPPVFEYREIKRKDFLVSLFGKYPRLRPHYLESFVFFCSNYLKEESFRKIVLEKTFIECPTLIERLFRIKCFTKNEIQESLLFHRIEFLCLFFKNEIEVNSDGFRNCDIQYCHDTELGF